MGGELIITITKEENMSLTEVTNKVNSLGDAWAEFKQTNDQRLVEIETKGQADPLLDEKLSRINNAIDNYKSRLDYIETKANRPELGAVEYKANDAFVSEYKKAFDGYLRKGSTTSLDGLEEKALSVGSDPDGGYLVSSCMNQLIVDTICQSSPMRKVANIETISSDSLEVIEDYDLAAAGWVNEADARTDTTTPQLGKKVISVHELYAMPKATQKLVDDSSVDIEQWIAAKVSDTFIREENNAFINGTGTGQPKGILTYADGTNWGEIQRIKSGVDGQISEDKSLS